MHLEVAISLNTDACINALRRFTARRGQVVRIQSDNATNFIGAERELREALEALSHSQIQGVLQQHGVTWCFNPPAGSHFGGIWERMIRMVRRILNSVLRQQVLDDDGLHTAICEAEAILNDRPITKLLDDPNDLEPLTPNHILLMKGKPALPPGLFEPHDLYVKCRWRQAQYISDLFWKQWVRQYLPLLQERQKWNQKRRNLKAGDVIIIMDSLLLEALACFERSWRLSMIRKDLFAQCGCRQSQMSLSGLLQNFACYKRLLFSRPVSY